MWDDCGTTDSTDLTLSCIGLRHVQLWFQQPFWQKGWANYLHSWTTATTQAADPTAASISQQLHMTERDLICHKLDARIRWIGCTQPDPTTVRAIGYYYGRIIRRRHWVPATFGRGGYQMELAYSYSSESDCQRVMMDGDSGSASGGGGVDGGLAVVTFDLCGSMETVNGHHLRLYDSLCVFLQSQAAEECVGVKQQVQQFIQQVEEDQKVLADSQEQMVEERKNGSGSVTSEQLKGLAIVFELFSNITAYLEYVEYGWLRIVENAICVNKRLQNKTLANFYCHSLSWS